MTKMSRKAKTKRKVNPRKSAGSRRSMKFRLRDPKTGQLMKATLPEPKPKKILVGPGYITEAGLVCDPMDVLGLGDGDVLIIPR